MHRKKIAAITMAAIISNMSAGTVEVLAHEISNQTISIESQTNETVEQATITKFELQNSDKLNAYNEAFKMNNSNIASITNNGGTYASSTIDKAIDGNLSTHWETGSPNKENFTNEVVVTLNEVTSLNRIVYAARQDSAKGKGFAQQVEIYASLSDDGDDFKLVANGEYNASTRDLVEIKFKSTEFKRIKFKFIKASQDWASASEFMFYKEDTVGDKLNRIFTNEQKNQVSEEFNTVDKLNELEEEAKSYVLYENYKEDFENARIILSTEKIEATEAKVSRFDEYYSTNKNAYDEVFKMDNTNIQSIVSAGGKLNQSVGTENIIDGKLDTYWETGRQSNFQNELTFTFKEATVLDKIAYRSAWNTVGFATEFEIWASSTTSGDTFQKVSTGQASKTADVIEIKFEPTKFKRLKFVFKNSGTATASEMMFYKEDKTLDKVKSLFTDSTMSEVSEEFNTVEKLNALEEEFKSHPLYNEYKEQIENARIIIENSGVEYKDAKVSEFLQYSDKKLNEYDEMFKIKREDITSITTNGSQYAHNSIDRAIDGDVSTQWHSGKQNNDTFTNEFTITLDKLTTIDRITYKNNVARGFAEAFDIYVSKTSTGDTFEKVTSGTASRTTDNLVIQFNPTEARRVKFVFKKGYENWAIAYEVGLYTPDEVKDKVERIFITSGMDTVSEEFNTIEKLEELEKQAINHPLYETFKETIDEAKDIVSGKMQNIKTVVAEQQGDRVAHANNNLKIGFGTNNQPTGVVAMAGDTITVYVDAEEGKPLPKLYFSQQEGSWASWGNTVQLKAGKNIIKVPKVSQNDGWYHHSVTPGGPVYIVNPYTSDQQGKAPTIRFASGVEVFPMFDENTNEEEFLAFLKEYKEKVDADAKANPNVMDRKMIDVFELVTDRIVLTATASAAYEAYIKGDFKPSESVTMYNNHMDMLFKYQGLDGSSEKNDPKYIRENIRLAQPYGYMYAAGNHTGVQSSQLVGLLTTVGGWGIDHEIGHRMDIGVRTVGEVTNNMLPRKSAAYYNQKPGNEVPYESEIYKNVIATDNNVFSEGGYFEKLGAFWQLEMVYPEYWAKLNKIYREKNITVSNENDKLDKMVYYSSMALEVDLTEYFERHGFPVTDATKEFASNYQKPSKKIWYANTSYLDYEGEGFTDNPNVFVKTSKSGENIKVTFGVDEKYKNDVIGYEVYRNGKLIAFTSTNSFTDTEVNYNDNVTYKIVPFDKKLNEGESVEVSSYKPLLSVQQSEVTLKLGEEFDPKSIVKATDYKGEDITDDIVITHNIDTSKKGTYEIKYSVTNENIETTKTVKVNVVSNYDYLSDYTWVSTETQFGTPRKNTNIKGRVNGEITTFEKGFGIHANGKIVYDLSDKDYDTFEALLGVDMNIESQTRSSITFKIVGDGKTLATTKVLKHADDMIYVNVPVKGVEKLTIEIHDGGNGNSSDHAIIVNPKLTTNNCKPKLTIPSSISTKVGEKIDLNQEFSAIDAEDGDITSKVEVSGSVNFYKPGKYDITYKVVDSDGNEVVKTRNVAVVDMQDSKYLSDFDWKSETHSYAAPKKDVATSGNALRLTDENDEVVTFDKGIGAHSKSTIVYDLSDKDYAYFTSYIGVDRQMYNSVGSVSFEVYVDGVKKYDSGLMNSKDPMKYLEVDINGAKELKLVVTDGGNGNGSDHATWADAKLHFANSERESIESEARKELRKLLEYAETITEDMIGATTHVEQRWSNFISAKDTAKKCVEDFNKTDEEITNSIYELNYYISELYIESETKIELRELLEYADTINKDMIGATTHAEGKWSNFVYARDLAKQYLEDDSKTDEDFESCIFMINYYMSELELKSEL